MKQFLLVCSCLIALCCPSIAADPQLQAALSLKHEWAEPYRYANDYPEHLILRGDLGLLVCFAVPDDAHPSDPGLLAGEIRVAGCNGTRNRITAIMSLESWEQMQEDLKANPGTRFMQSTDGKMPAWFTDTRVPSQRVRFSRCSGRPLHVLCLVHLANQPTDNSPNVSNQIEFVAVVYPHPGSKYWPKPGSDPLPGVKMVEVNP